jgi:hypothetical protein
VLYTPTEQAAEVVGEGGIAADENRPFAKQIWPAPHPHGREGPVDLLAPIGLLSGMDVNSTFGRTPSRVEDRLECGPDPDAAGVIGRVQVETARQVIVDGDGIARDQPRTAVPTGAAAVHRAPPPWLPVPRASYLLDTA